MNTNERENQQLFVSWEIGSSSYFLKGTNAVVLQCINQGTTFFCVSRETFPFNQLFFSREKRDIKYFTLFFLDSKRCAYFFEYKEAKKVKLTMGRRVRKCGIFTNTLPIISKLMAIFDAPIKVLNE